MATREHNARQIEAAARTALEKSGPHLVAAREYAERFTEVPKEALGLVTAESVGTSYAAGRDSQTDNLRHAVDRLEAMSDGLAEVARAYRQTKRANTIEPRESASEQVEVTEPSANLERLAGSWLNFLQPTAGAIGLIVLVGSAIEQKLAAARLLTVSAGAATAAWAGCVMLDPFSVDKALAAWTKVAEELDQVDVEADVREALDDTDWSGDARAAYDGWVKAFSAEVADAKQAAEETASTLTTAFWTVLALNLAMLTYATTMVYTLVLLDAIEKTYPPASGLMRAVKLLMGQSLAIVTAVTAGSIAVSVGLATGGVLTASALVEGGFGEMEVGKGGGERTFVDRDVDWDRV